MSHVPACRCSFCRQYVTPTAVEIRRFEPDAPLVFKDIPIVTDCTMPRDRIDLRQHGRTVAAITNVAPPKTD